MSIKSWSDFNSMLNLLKKIQFLLLLMMIAAIGFACGKLFQTDNLQLLSKSIEIEGIDLVFNLRDELTEKLAGLLALFFSITSCAMYYFWCNQNQIESINKVIKALSGILKLPSKFLYSCWFFVMGFSLVPILAHSQFGWPIFSLGTLMFGLPALMLSYWLKGDFFKPITYPIQKFLYPWTIGVFVLAAVVAFLYGPIEFVLSISDWHEFIKIHWPGALDASSL
jgi:hypothetical protein